MDFKKFLQISDVKIHNWHTNSYKNQHNFTIYATIGEKDIVIGKLDYVIFENKPHISWIEVVPEYQKMGIAEKMIAKILEEYDYKDISWGMLTPPGSKLKQKLDKKSITVNN